MKEQLGKLPCEKPTRDPIKEAGENVGLDLKSPIDCSEMIVHQISRNPIQTDRGQCHFIRESVIWAQVFNELGEPEELKITFELKSTRVMSPKKRQQTQGEAIQDN